MSCRERVEATERNQEERTEAGGLHPDQRGLLCEVLSECGTGGRKEGDRESVRRPEAGPGIPGLGRWREEGPQF